LSSDLSVRTHLSHPLIRSSIGCRVGERSPGETDPAIAGIENRVEPLQECHAADEIHARELSPAVLYGQVNGVFVAAYGGVERAGPDLGVRSQLECIAADDKVERLEALVLRVGNAEELIGIVQYPASGIDVFIICT
jgi:hypothetical protein